jgi:hypothetical protein
MLPSYQVNYPLAKQLNPSSMVWPPNLGKSIPNERIYPSLLQCTLLQITLLKMDEMIFSEPKTNEEPGDSSSRLARVESFTTETNNPQGFCCKTLAVKPQELSPM